MPKISNSSGMCIPDVNTAPTTQQNKSATQEYHSRLRGTTIYVEYGALKVLPPAIGNVMLAPAWSAQRASLGQELHHRHVVSGLAAFHGEVRLQQQTVEPPELV